MTERKITSSSVGDDKIKELYQTAFPEEEQIGWDDLMRLVDEMPLDFMAYYEEEMLVGFTIVYPRKPFNWFWYFAVCDELRGKGYGQKILTHLIERYKDRQTFSTWNRQSRYATTWNKESADMVSICAMVSETLTSIAPTAE